MRSETDFLETDAVLVDVSWQWYAVQEKLKCTSDRFGEPKYGKACLKLTLTLQ
jgi:hypothetical protein